MRSSRNYSQRESRTAPTSIPTVPDLGRLSMPRKTNRAAAKIVASGDVLWDKRRVARKAQKRALQIREAHELRPGHHVPSRRQKLWIGKRLSDWSWAERNSVLVAPRIVTEQQLDDLVSMTHLPYAQRAVLRIQGLTLEQLTHVGQRAPRTALLIHVDPATKTQQRIRAASIG
jgi:hypothetical protein